ncbi:MAG: DUF4860 domain-containing protein [Clostridiaceae bacterium]
MERATAAREPRGNIRGVFVFALMAAFALLSLVVVVIGAKSYRSIYQTADEAHTYRTGMRYIIGKVRGADEAGMLSLQTENGMDVLVLGSLYDGERYNTYIYCDNGAIKEYFSADTQAFDASYGEEILKAQELHFTLEQKLLTISLTGASGNTYVSKVALSAAGGDAS